MTLKHRHREITTFLCVTLGIVAAVIVGGPTMRADGPLFEILLKTRSMVSPPTEPPEAAAVAVIAIDPRSLDEPELADLPRTMMAPVWGRVLDVVFGAGAKAIGFDVLFAFSSNRVVPDFDAPFLAALSRHRERVVLARSVTQVPAMPFLGALRNDPAALGLGEIAADRDGGYRRVPPDYRTSDNEVVPGLAAGVLRRGGATMSRTVVVTPTRHLETLPTYALIDVLRCVDAPEALARAFRGKLVFIGTTMPEEDRRHTSGRLLTPPTVEGPALHACGLRRLAASVPHSETVPGVYIHAAAADAVARNRVVATASTPVIASVAAASGGLGAVAGFALTPWMAFAAIVVLIALLFAGGTVALAGNVWLPVALPLGVLVAAPVVAYVVRYVVEDRVRRRIENAFSHYLAPSVVERLSKDAAALRLGGELREVTLMFADLSGFTALSGKVSAEVLTRVTNEYLGYIVEAVEATGGYVDKFIGDAVMGMWGAPAADPKHATNAVRTALAAVARIRIEHARAQARGEVGYGVKIGLNSGPAVVGNVGTEKRFNYTAIGETVNVAARLESVPGIYTCDVVVGPRTAELAANDFFWLELDTIRVKGREAPLVLSAPLAPLDAASMLQQERARRFGVALASYRAAQFSEAAVAWDALATDARDWPEMANPARAMARRAREFALKPPDEPWDGVWVLTSK